eukprot:SAG31_NODE_1074_length_10052_cov_88.255400_7_plen_106_part_00
MPTGVGLPQSVFSTSQRSVCGMVQRASVTGIDASRVQHPATRAKRQQHIEEETGGKGGSLGAESDDRIRQQTAVAQGGVNGTNTFVKLRDHSPCDLVRVQNCGVV